MLSVSMVSRQSRHCSVIHLRGYQADLHHSKPGPRQGLQSCPPSISQRSRVRGFSHQNTPLPCRTLSTASFYPYKKIQTLPISPRSPLYPAHPHLARQPLQHALAHLGPSKHPSHLSGVPPLPLLMMDSFPPSRFGFKDAFSDHPVQAIPPLFSSSLPAQLLTGTHHRMHPFFFF